MHDENDPIISLARLPAQICEAASITHNKQYLTSLDYLYLIYQEEDYQTKLLKAYNLLKYNNL